MPSLSFSEIRKALCDAFTAAFPNSGGDIVDIYQDRCIIRDNTGTMYEVPYSIDDGGGVITGDMTRVRRRVEYVMVANSMNLPENVNGAIPAEIQVIPYGHTDTPKGPFVLNETAAQAVINAFDTRKNDVVIDYEHQTIAYPPVEAPAAGWIKKLINKGKDGIWAVVEWTEKAKQYIANKEYRYVSPVFFKYQTNNEVFRLVNVALTNQPNIDGMVPLVNKMAVDFQAHKEDGMKDLLKLLGLAETATEADAIAAVNKLKIPVQIVANKGVLDALGLAEGATEAEITGTIMAMKQSHDKIGDLSAQVTQLTNKLTERESTEAVELAMKEGKIAPAQQEWATEYAKRDLEGFKVFVAKAPVVVVQGKVVNPDKPGDGTAIDDVQLQINKMCGVDEKMFKEFGPKDQE